MKVIVKICTNGRDYTETTMTIAEYNEYKAENENDKWATHRYRLEDITEDEIIVIDDWESKF